MIKFVPTTVFPKEKPRDFNDWQNHIRTLLNQMQNGNYSFTNNLLSDSPLPIVESNEGIQGISEPKNENNK